MSFTRSMACGQRNAANFQVEGLERRVLLSSYSLDTLTPLATNVTGGKPRAGLTIDANGNLFGTTSVGGAFGLGTVFEIPHGSSNLSPWPRSTALMAQTRSAAWYLTAAETSTAQHTTAARITSARSSKSCAGQTALHFLLHSQRMRTALRETW